MISMTFQAIAIEDPLTEDFCCAVVHGSNDIVHVDMNQIVETVKFEFLAEFCARRGYNLQVELATHHFQPKVQPSGNLRLLEGT